MLKRFFHHVKFLASKTFNGAFEDDITLQGAAIAFYTIFSIAPLIIITLWAVALFLGEQGGTTYYSGLLEQMVGEDVTTQLMTFARESRADSSGFFATILAVGLLLFGATTVVTQLRETLNTIWGVHTPSLNSVKLFLLNRAIALVTIMVLASLLIIALVFEGGMTLFKRLIEQYISATLAPVIQIISSVISISMTMLFFTILFRVLPDVHAEWKDVIVGGLVTTLLFLIGKYALGFYLLSDRISTGYMAAGAFVIFLVWIYYSVQIVLLGAEFTQAYTKHYGSGYTAARRAQIKKDKK